MTTIDTGGAPRYCQSDRILWRDTASHVLVLQIGSRDKVTVLGGGSADLWAAAASSPHEAGDTRQLRGRDRRCSGRAGGPGRVGRPSPPWAGPRRGDPGVISGPPPSVTASTPLARAVASFGLVGSMHDAPTTPLNNRDFTRLHSAVRSQRMTGLLWSAIAGGWFPVTQAQLARAQESHLQSLAATLILEHLLVDTVSAFDEAGIAVRALKGHSGGTPGLPGPRDEDVRRHRPVGTERGVRRRGCRDGCGRPRAALSAAETRLRPPLQQGHQLPHPGRVGDRPASDLHDRSPGCADRPAPTVGTPGDIHPGRGRDPHLAGGGTTAARGLPRGPRRCVPHASCRCATSRRSC